MTDRAGVGEAVEEAARRAPSAVRAVAVAGAVHAATAAVCAWRLAAARSAPEGAAAVTPRDAVLRVALGAAFAALLVAGVLWLRWFRALHRAVDRAGRARFPGDWWLWAWVIPVLNVFRPKQLVNDAWRAADAPGEVTDPPWPVRVWWGLWVAGRVADVLGRASLSDVTAAPRWADAAAVAEHTRALASATVWAALLAVAAPFAVVTIRQLTGRVARLGPPGQSAGVEPPSTGTTQPVT